MRASLIQAFSTRHQQPIEPRDGRCTSRTRSCRTAAAPTVTSTFTAAIAHQESCGTDEATYALCDRARDRRAFWIRAPARAGPLDAARGRPTPCSGAGFRPRDPGASVGHAGTRCDAGRYAVSGLVSEVEPEHRSACAPERRAADADGVLPHRRWPD